MGTWGGTDKLRRLKIGLSTALDGVSAALSGLQGEPAYTTDTKQFFIHDGTRYLPPNFDMIVAYENEGVFYENEQVISY